MTRREHHSATVEPDAISMVHERNELPGEDSSGEYSNADDYSHSGEIQRSGSPSHDESLYSAPHEPPRRRSHRPGSAGTSIKRGLGVANKELWLILSMFIIVKMVHYFTKGRHEKVIGPNYGKSLAVQTVMVLTF